MGLWVRNDIRLNMLRSTVTSKDVRPAAWTTTRRSQSVRFCAKLQVMRGGRTNGRAVTLTVRPEFLSFHRRRLERKIDEKSLKNLLYENPGQIAPKSTKNRSWVVLGDQGRFGDVSGHTRDGLWMPKRRPKADLGTPRASQ